MCMSTPKAPAQQPLPPVVQEQDAATKESLARRKTRMSAMTGYQGTILSGQTGNVGATVLGG